MAERASFFEGNCFSSIAAMLSGELVVNARSTKRHSAALEAPIESPETTRH
jgi:hypothetical protein